MSCNSEILIIQHLRVVTRPEVLLFTRKKGLRPCSQDLQECPYIDCCGMSWPLSPPSTASAMKTPEITEEDPGDPEPT
jgi:hypothetical protein